MLLLALFVRGELTDVTFARAKDPNAPADVGPRLTSRTFAGLDAMPATVAPARGGGGRGDEDDEVTVSSSVTKAFRFVRDGVTSASWTAIPLRANATPPVNGVNEGPSTASTVVSAVVETTADATTTTTETHTEAQVETLPPAATAADATEAPKAPDVDNKAPVPAEAPTPARVIDPTPAPIEGPTPVIVPAEPPTPAPIIEPTPTPAPIEASTPVPAEPPTPVPAEPPTPAPVEAPTPVPAEPPTPAPVEAPTPVPVELPTPEPAPTPVPAEPPTPVPQPPTPAPVEPPTPAPVIEPTPTPVPAEPPTPAPVNSTPLHEAPVPAEAPTPVPAEAPTPAPVATPIALVPAAPVPADVNVSTLPNTTTTDALPIVPAGTVAPPLTTDDDGSGGPPTPITTPTAAAAPTPPIGVPTTGDTAAPVATLPIAGISSGSTSEPARGPRGPFDLNFASLSSTASSRDYDDTYEDTTQDDAAENSSSADRPTGDSVDASWVLTFAPIIADPTDTPAVAIQHVDDNDDDDVHHSNANTSSGRPTPLGGWKLALVIVGAICVVIVSVISVHLRHVRVSAANKRRRDSSQQRALDSFFRQTRATLGRDTGLSSGVFVTDPLTPRDEIAVTMPSGGGRLRTKTADFAATNALSYASVRRPMTPGALDTPTDSQQGNEYDSFTGPVPLARSSSPPAFYYSNSVASDASSVSFGSIGPSSSSLVPLPSAIRGTRASSVTFRADARETYRSAQSSSNFSVRFASSVSSDRTSWASTPQAQANASLLSAPTSERTNASRRGQHVQRSSVLDGF
ncbi:unnamed protein product [Hyaloperonospora brassicae]|uniref:Uncharacterized protein n=1 Tax=Hyaloperonospora brassicae TaxID=162125 RepID=A0AAV0SWP8_HYABA|nr:unnamed protein product [Hyaloperonospora brassicae]